MGVEAPSSAPGVLSTPHVRSPAEHFQGRLPPKTAITGSQRATSTRQATPNILFFPVSSFDLLRNSLSGEIHLHAACTNRYEC